MLYGKYKKVTSKGKARIRKDTHPWGGSSLKSIPTEPIYEYYSLRKMEGIEIRLGKKTVKQILE